MLHPLCARHFFNIPSETTFEGVSQGYDLLLTRRPSFRFAPLLASFDLLSSDCFPSTTITPLLHNLPKPA
jgi:hypothetical protein